MIQILTYGSGAWLGGALADRMQKRPLMITGLLALAAGYALIPMAQSLAVIYALAAFCSFVQILVFPVGFSLAAECAQGEKLSRLLGMYGLSLLLGAAVAGFSVGPLFEALGFANTFRLSGSICFAIALYTMLCEPVRLLELESEAQHDRAPAKPQEAMPPLDVRRKFMIAALALNFTGFFIGLTHQTFLVRIASLPEFSLSLTQQSLIQGSRLTGGILGYACGAAWVGWHWKRWPFWLAGAWLTGVALISGFAPNGLVLGIGIAIGGLATSFGNQASLYYCIGSGVVEGGRGAGLSESALAAGGGIGPLTAGFAAAAVSTPRAACFVGILPLAISFVIWSRMPSRGPKA